MIVFQIIKHNGIWIQLLEVVRVRH